MTAELLDLLVRMTPPSPRLEVVADNNNGGLETAKVVIGANSHVKQRLADLRADLAVLEFELKLLSRLLYKLHNRFRNDRGYKALRMLEKSGKSVLILLRLKFYSLNCTSGVSSLDPWYSRNWGARTSEWSVGIA